MLKKILILSLFWASSAFAEINIALMAPIEGDYAHIGYELLDGARTAVETINKNGGVNGKKINLIEIGDACGSKTALFSAEMLSLIKENERKISMVVGPYCSDDFKQIAKTLEKAEITQLIPTSISIDEYNARKTGMLNAGIFLEDKINDFYQYYKNHFFEKKIALIYNADVESNAEMYLALYSLLKKDNHLSYLSRYNIKDYKSFDALAESVDEGGEQLVYVLGSIKEVLKASYEIKKENESIDVFIDADNLNKEYLKEMKKFNNEPYVIAMPTLKNNPNFAEELVKLRLMGLEPKGVGMYSYNAIKIWHEIISNIKSFDYDNISKEIKSNNYNKNMYHSNIYKLDNLDTVQVY